MADTTNLKCELEIVSKPGVHFDVQGIEGEESVSSLFRFVVSTTLSDNTDTASLVGERAKLTITTACGSWVTSGIVFQVQELDPTPTELRVVQFVIKPRFVVTNMAVENRIFGPGQPVSVDDVVKQELARAPINIPADYILDAYSKRNYIVQYEESDLNFISRLCEHQGIFYYFRQENSGETIVFGDKNIAFPKVKFGSKQSILYSHPGDQKVARRADESAVLSFRQSRFLTTKSVKLRDYNETIPSIVSGEKAAGQGNAFLGTIDRFGAHFADDSAGAALAKVRAEQLAVGQTVFYAETDAPELRAGVIFKLEGHPRLDGEYLVTKANHSAYRPAPIGFQALPQTGRAYRNSLQCIRSDVPFRPTMQTPRPAGLGLHTAKVDGESWNGRAEIDSEGRYKLQLSFPGEQAARSRGSDFVRKVEPYVGPGQTGLHFPLVAGTEVIVGYINGDIDRPVVLGAVANPDMRSIVTADTHTYNRIKSQSGSMFEIFDGAP